MESGKRKLVVFTAKWCSPCREFKKAIALARDRGADIEEVDVDSDDPRIGNWMVMSVPTTVAVASNGEGAGSRNGPISADDLVAFAMGDQERL
jgi:thioredoxin-like negative regulator of GroEL